MAVARTTVRLDPALMKAAKQRALDSNTTLTGLIEEALRRVLAAPPVGARSRRVRLPVFHGRGLLSGATLDHNAELLDLMEAR